MRVLLSPAMEERRAAQRRVRRAVRHRDAMDRKAVFAHEYLRAGEITTAQYDDVAVAQYEAHADVELAERYLADVEQSLGLLDDEDGAA